VKSFKQFFNEAIQSETPLPEPPKGFSVPPPRAKYQLGDVIVIQSPQDEEYIKARMPKYLHPYINAVGRIVGHRISGISTHYAVEFEDGTIGKVSSGFVVGAFRSFDSAKKYQGRKKLVPADIAPEDHKRHAEAQSKMGANEVIENAFKELFVKSGEFEWLEKPIIFNTEGRHKAVVLAISTSSITEGQGGNWGFWSEKAPQIKDKLFFCKAIDPATNQLVKTSSIVDSGSGFYCLTTPSMTNLTTKGVFKKGQLESIENYYNRSPVNSTKGLVQHKNEFDRLAHLNTIKDGMEFFDFVNNVKEKGSLKIVPNQDYHRVDIPEGITTNLNAFKNYVFDGGVVCSCNINGQIVFPKEVKGDQLTISSNKAVENLKGFPITSPDTALFVASDIHSFEGLPSPFVGDLRAHHAFSLKGFPKVIKGNCDFAQIDSFEGGKDSVVEGYITIRSKQLPSFSNIPEATNYHIYALSHEEQDKIKSTVKKRKLVDKNLSKDFDVSALEDF